jgi:hypothetical protein
VRPFAAAGSRALLVALTTAALALWDRPASAFGLEGHAIIEAAAYKRLLALEQVPGTAVSGRALLSALMTAGVLYQPPCLEGERGRRGCGPDDRLERPMRFWPVLGSGAADLLIDRQLSARAQCQHFMAESADGLSPIDPRFGVPRGLVTDAYVRCVMVLGLGLEGILRAPRLANGRLVGMYALIHAIGDSFSPAHATRDEHGRIVHLLSWTLLDWPTYLGRGMAAFPARVHHGVSDQRDRDYLVKDGRSLQGQPCAAFHNPYAMPDACLTPRARAAANAIADLLLLTYRLRAQAAAAGRLPSLAVKADQVQWEDYLRTHLPSVAAPVEPPPTGQHLGFARADVFVGPVGSITREGWGAGVWGSRMFYGPAAPLALTLYGAAGFARESGHDGGVAELGLSLQLPLVRRFAIGAAPVAVNVACQDGLHDCATFLFATLGDLIIPLPHSTWLGLRGPRWSWHDRELRGPLVAFAFGWSYERAPPESGWAPGGVPSWNPPAEGEVRAFRKSRMSRLVFFSATAASTAQNQWVSGGLEVRRDIDRWNRRAGWSPALSLAVAHGTTQGSHGETLAVVPALLVYLVPNRLALAARPAALRIGAMAGKSLTADVAAQLALALDVGRLELALESPPLSYVSQARWHPRPWSVRLGLLFD